MNPKRRAKSDEGGERQRYPGIVAQPADQQIHERRGQAGLQVIQQQDRVHGADRQPLS